MSFLIKNRLYMSIMLNTKNLRYRVVYALRHFVYREKLCVQSKHYKTWSDLGFTKHHKLINGQRILFLHFLCLCIKCINKMTLLCHYSKVQQTSYPNHKQMFQVVMTRSLIITCTKLNCRKTETNKFTMDNYM